MKRIQPYSKTSIKKENKKSVRSEIYFARAFTFYVQLKTQRHWETYFFNVLVTTAGTMNLDTGMTVDLMTLNRRAGFIFKNEKAKCKSLAEFLQKKFQTLNKILMAEKIQLISAQFNECRGLSVLFENKNFFLIRNDFAFSKEGELFFISSYFNKSNLLTKIILKDLKLNIEEQIIF